MKTVLESDKISYSINNWIDLIFGNKARGKEAENANNIFTAQSYQENVDISKKKDKGAFLRQVEFGLIPNQVMNKNCPKREKKENVIKGRQITDPASDLKIYKCKTHNNKENHCVLKIGINGERINILTNSHAFVDAKISWQVFDKKFNEEIANKYKIGKLYNNILEYQYPKKYSDKNIVFCNNRKKIIIGGFYDGKVLIISYEPKVEVKELLPFSEEIPIISIAINKNEDYLFLGDILGNVKIYKINDDIEKYETLYLITDQFSPISHLNCNEELNMWVSASIDGYIDLYTLPLCKLIRIIKVPINKCNYAFLSAFPIPSIIIIGEEEEKQESEIFVYSINGHLIMRQKEQYLITCPIIIKDINSYEYLAYIGKDNIIIRNLPSLYLQVNIDNLEGIYAFCPNEDNKIVYAINQNYDEIYVIKEEMNNKFKNLLLINKNNVNNNK
jgi:WD40 repeat protein